MEEDKLKDLFVNYNPELPSDFSFMTRLKHNLDQVELVKRHNSEIASKRKKAVAIAACVGFIVGLLFSLTLPYIGNMMTSLQSSLPSGSTLKMIADNYLTVTLLIMGASTALLSLNAYDLSLSLLSLKSTK